MKKGQTVVDADVNGRLRVGQSEGRVFRDHRLLLPCPLFGD